jgi:hypothetical protein
MVAPDADGGPVVNIVGANPATAYLTHACSHEWQENAQQ